MKASEVSFLHNEKIFFNDFRLYLLIYLRTLDLYPIMFFFFRQKVHRFLRNVWEINHLKFSNLHHFLYFYLHKSPCSSARYVPLHSYPAAKWYILQLSPCSQVVYSSIVSLQPSGIFFHCLPVAKWYILQLSPCSQVVYSSIVSLQPSGIFFHCLPAAKWYILPLSPSSQVVYSSIVSLNQVRCSSTSSHSQMRYTSINWLVWFDGISTIVGYSMPNPVYTDVLDIYDL